MDVVTIVYLQYWLQVECEASFRKYMDIIQKNFGKPKSIGENDSKTFIPPILDCSELEVQQPLFNP